MKTIVMIILSCVCVSLIAVDKDPVASRRRRGIGKPDGGFIELPNTGKVIQVSNSQVLCPKGAVNGTANMIRVKFGYPVEVFDKELCGQFPSNVALRINVVAKQHQPVLLVAPEEGWAQVNVTPLTADNPDEIRLRKRVIREMWRAFAYSCGVGLPMDSFSVMKTVNKVHDLDEIPVEFGPEAQFKIARVAKERGLLVSRRVRYITACKEGWAPAPTNEIQKAIWDKVHAMPTKPLTIKPESKPVSK